MRKLVSTVVVVVVALKAKRTLFGSIISPLCPIGECGRRLDCS